MYLKINKDETLYWIIIYASILIICYMLLGSIGFVIWIFLFILIEAIGYKKEVSK